MKRVPSKQRNSKIHRDRDLRALSRLALLLFCGLVLASGFVFAARQHFAAVQYGYQSEGLRRERDRLLQEQQHLLLRKERAFAPARLESEARELGLRPVAASQLETQKSGRRSQLPLAQALLNPSATLRR
ncbi:MAG: cell division protein FtsL [Acidobacteriota bacterium]|nr:cell division protein FtsL [Acidobacteriota bacterium]